MTKSARKIKIGQEIRKIYLSIFNMHVKLAKQLFPIKLVIEPVKKSFSPKPLPQSPNEPNFYESKLFY